MDMKQTAMQEHIEWLKATLEICKEHAPTLVNCISLCISDAESRLEMERKQIMKAWIDGNYNIDSNGNPSENYSISDEKYYNKTFKSESYQQKMRDKINYYKNNFKSE
jgi:hypothetical protein